MQYSVDICQKYLNFIHNYQAPVPPQFWSKKRKGAALISSFSKQNIPWIHSFRVAVATPYHSKAIPFFCCISSWYAASFS